MGRIRTETGAIRAIRRKGFLNCFSTPERRYFVISSVALSKDGARLPDTIGHMLMREHKLRLVAGDSFRAAYALAFPQDVSGHWLKPLSPTRPLVPRSWWTKPC